MKWPLRNGGATSLRNVTDTVQTVQTVQYSDSQCQQQQNWHERQYCSWVHAGFYAGIWEGPGGPWCAWMIKEGQG